MSQLLLPLGATSPGSGYGAVEEVGGQDRRRSATKPREVDHAEQNKRDVFHATKHRHSRDRTAIAELLQRLGIVGATRHELATALHMPLTTVCGRVNELKKMQSVVEPGERRPTPAGKTAVVVVWRV